MQVDQLIRELIATGTMNEDTLADLKRWQAESEAGQLDADDAAYIAALHAKVTGAPLPEPIEEIEEVEEPRIDGLGIEEWRERALRAEAELAELRDQAAGEASRPA